MTDPDCKFCGGHGASFVDLFEREVHDRAGEIDSPNELDWYSLTLGWAIAKGMGLEEPSEAHQFALHIRYHTDLG